MTFPQKFSQRWRGALVGALLGVLFAFGAIAKFGEPLQRLSFDLPYQFRPDNLSSDDVLIVYMDDASRAELKQKPGETWDRSIHARLVNRLREAGARLVVFDVLLTTPGIEAEDRALENALAKFTNVVLAADLIPGREESFNIRQEERPLARFAQHAAAVGLANFSQDLDRVNRHHPEADDQLPSLAVAATKLLKPSFAAPENRWFNYIGPPRSIPHLSYASALGSDISKSRFADKIVFVGAATHASVLNAQMEEFPTPYSRLIKGPIKEQSPGVEIHATEFLNLMHGNFLSRLHSFLELTLLGFLGAAAGALFVLLAPIPALLTALVFAALYWVAALLLWTRGVWFAWLIFLLLQLPATFVWSLIYNAVRLQIEKAVLQESLSLHLSPARVAQLLTHPEFLKPGAEKQEITIMFTDIANFSKLSSRMEADDLFRLLNDYYERALTVIHENDGTVVKLIGDSIFAIWNAPFVQPDQQFHACHAALQLQASIIELEAQARSVPLRTRIGIHTGFAFVGNVGSRKRFDYTAIGDNVNLASRLEGMNKHLGTDVLITRDLHKIVAEKMTSRKIGFFRFKGLDRVIEIHEALGGPEIAEATRTWRDHFESGLFAFQRRDWNAAETAFRNAIAARGEDGPSLFYLERILEMRQAPPAQDWTGEVEMREK